MNEWPEDKQPTPSNLPQRKVYRPEETSKRFHGSLAKKRGIIGPIGSGKSTTCIQDILRIARNQAPGLDGSRSTRFLVARNTEVTLKRTTLASWQDWVPFGKLVTTPPIRWYYNGPDPFGGKHPLDMIVYFVGLDGIGSLEKLKSFEVTCVYLNEADQISKDLYMEADSRAGRWPSPKNCPAGITYSGTFFDANPTDCDHWLYRLCEIEKPIDLETFHQPPALLWNGIDWVPNPHAENIKNLAKGYAYYTDLTKGKTNDWIRVYVAGEWGSARRDKPVFPEYDDSIHCAKEDIKPMRGLPLVVGLDFGLNPTAVIGQVMQITGQLRIIDELTSDSMGLEQFLRDVFRPAMQTTYAGMSLTCVGDPAGMARSSIDSAQTIFSVLARYGIQARPSTAIRINPRIEAVKRLLITPCEVPHETPKMQRMLLLSPKCIVLRRGFIEKYRYAKTSQNDYGRYTTNICDDFCTHAMDSLEYLAFDWGMKLNNREANDYGQDQFQSEAPAPNRTWTYL